MSKADPVAPGEHEPKGTGHLRPAGASKDNPGDHEGSSSRDPKLEKLAVATIRGLAMDMPERARSGHPGTAMALAPLAHVIFTRVMNHDPSAPEWPDRDRFILSCGHASVLLYSMLHLCGYGISLDDLMHFRQLGSITPGHPEAGIVPGVEVTTGPLGQGLGNAVGMALAERMLRDRLGDDVMNHYTYVIASDGDMMEGISHEAGSLAGHLGLGHLVCIYDDNRITIDGPTSLAFSDDTASRFESYGWHVDRLGDIADDTDLLDAALARARLDPRPSLLVLRSHIGRPSPHKTDTSAAHGEPLGPDEVRLTKELLGLPPDREMYVPSEVVEYYRHCVSAGREMRKSWEKRIAGLEPARAELLSTLWPARPDPGWESTLPVFSTSDPPVATRAALKKCIDATAASLPFLVAGSADLTSNTGVSVAGFTDQEAASPSGSQLHFGIREHAMGAAMLGAARHGGVLPVGGTFFIFSDYMKPSIRLAALSRTHVIYSFTHDSIGLGEDGPTHQPVEQLAALRAIPGMTVIRPADANETAEAWRVAVESDGPVALILSRQALPVLEGTVAEPASGKSVGGNDHACGTGLARGGYILADFGRPGTPPGSAPGDPARRITLIATGSEVATCLGARDLLHNDGIDTRVVSLPSWELFEEQDEAYRLGVLGDVPRLAVEAAGSLGWERYAASVLCMTTFGRSGPGPEVMRSFGFDPATVATVAKDLLEQADAVVPAESSLAVPAGAAAALPGKSQDTRR